MMHGQKNINLNLLFVNNGMLVNTILPLRPSDMCINKCGPPTSPYRFMWPSVC